MFSLNVIVKGRNEIISTFKGCKHVHRPWKKELIARNMFKNYVIKSRQINDGDAMRLQHHEHTQ